MAKPLKLGHILTALSICVFSIPLSADEPEKKVPNVEDVLDGYDAAIKDVNAPVKDAIEASRARKNAKKEWTYPADSSLSRFTKEITSEWTFWGLVGLELGKDIYIVNTALQKTRRLKRELEEASRIVEEKNQKLESVRAWQTEVKSIHDALGPKLIDLEKAARTVIDSEGKTDYQTSYNAFKKIYGEVKTELNTKITEAGSPGIRTIFDPWEPIEDLEKNARQEIRIHKLEPEVAKIVKQRSEILRENRISDQMDQLATRHIPDTEKMVQQAKERIERLEHRRGGWKWRWGSRAGIFAVIALPKVGWVIYERRMKAASEDNIAEIQRILEELEKRNGESFNDLLIDNDVLPLRKTIVLVWMDFFDPADPYVPQWRDLSETEISCPVFDAGDPTGGDTSSLKKVGELKRSVLGELAGQTSETSDQAGNGAGTITVLDPRLRLFNHLFFKKVFTKLLEKRPKITADMDPRSIEDLITQLSEAAFEEFAVIQQEPEHKSSLLPPKTRFLPPSSEEDE